jgi:hypothetical protein
LIASSVRRFLLTALNSKSRRDEPTPGPPSSHDLPVIRLGLFERALERFHFVLAADELRQSASRRDLEMCAE